MTPYDKPKWLAETALDEDEYSSAHLEFLIRRAAVHHNRQGKLSLLAKAIGVTPQAFREVIERGYMSAPMAIAMELLLGADIAPREQLTGNRLAAD
jgi:hypothetical protein